jgi:protein-tyrosine phosphatase
MAFGLGGRPRLLLGETPYAGWPLDFSERLLRLVRTGFTVVLGHPERNPDVQRRPELLEPLVRAGLVVQLTTASLVGTFGRTARRTALELLDRGLAQTAGSDAHDPSGRVLGRNPVEETLGDATLARWLVEDVPAALLAGQSLPPRPPARPRRRRLLRLR